jgi:hypothetical protein
MTAHDYLPGAYAALVTWLNNFQGYTQSNLSRFNISEDQLSVVSTAAGAFLAADVKAGLPNAGKVDHLDRKEKADAVRTVVRNFVNEFLRFNSAVTDEDRVSLGLTVPDRKPTPSPVPGTYPVATVDTSIILRLTLHYQDINSLSRAKPDGVHGAEIRWSILDTPPTDTEDLVHSEFSTCSPVTFEFKEYLRGKTAYFRLCWENTRGQKGPWSEIISAIVP